MARLPKRPRKPRQSASLQVWERFAERFKDWEKRVSMIKTDKKKKENLIRKFS